MESWRKSGWSSLKSDSPRQSPYKTKPSSQYYRKNKTDMEECLGSATGGQWATTSRWILQYDSLHIHTIRIYYGAKVRMWLWHRRRVRNPLLEDSHNFTDAFRHSHMTRQSHHSWSQQPDNRHQSLIKLLYIFMENKEIWIFFFCFWRGHFKTVSNRVNVNLRTFPTLIMDYSKNVISLFVLHIYYTPSKYYNAPLRYTTTSINPLMSSDLQWFMIGSVTLVIIRVPSSASLLLSLLVYPLMPSDL
jgi:hypothetical protein